MVTRCSVFKGADSEFDKYFFENNLFGQVWY